MFELYVKSGEGENVRYEPFDKVDTVCPVLPIRLEIMALTVACELSDLGYFSPNETPTSVVTEMVDMAVARHFPGMDRFGWNERYVRLMVRSVGKRAFALIQAEDPVLTYLAEFA